MPRPVPSSSRGHSNVVALPLIKGAQHANSSTAATARERSADVDRSDSVKAPLTSRGLPRLASVYETQPWRAALDAFREANAASDDRSGEARDAHDLIRLPRIARRRTGRRSPRSSSPLDGANIRTYIADTLVALRTDEAAWVNFTQRADEMDSARKEAKRDLAVLMRPALQASRIPVDHAAATERRNQHADAVQSNRFAIARQEMETRIELKNEHDVKAAHAETLRHQMHASRLLRKQWFLNCVLAKSVAAIAVTLHAGYRARWIRLVCLYGGRHWLRRARKRQAVFASLRLNFFIRRNLPNMVENFRYRRSTAAAPVVAKFLKHYSHVMGFIGAVRQFTKRVRQCQTIVRRKRFANTVLVGALRLGWDAAANTLRKEKTMLIEFPEEVRDVILNRCIKADRVAFGNLRTSIYADWQRLRREHENFINTRNSLLGDAGRRDGAQYTTSRALFIEKQFSTSRHYLDSGATSSSSPAALGATPGGGGPDQAAPRVAGALALTNAADQMLVLLRNNAERRIAAPKVEPAGSKLHPSQRFGGNKNRAAPNNVPPSPTHAAVAAGKIKLMGSASTKQHQSPAMPPAVVSAAVNQSAASVNPDPRRVSVVGQATSGTSKRKTQVARRTSFAPLPPTVGVLPGVVDPEYLLQPPHLPPRKVLCRMVFMRELIARARDAMYAGIRKYRAEASAAAARASADDNGDPVAPASTAPPPAVRIHIVTKKSHTGGSAEPASAADAFTVPPAFTEPEVLAQSVDFNWIVSLVNNTPPHYSVAAMVGADPGQNRRRKASVASF